MGLGLGHWAKGQVADRCVVVVFSAVWWHALLVIEQFFGRWMSLHFLSPRFSLSPMLMVLSRRREFRNELIEVCRTMSNQGYD